MYVLIFSSWELRAVGICQIFILFLTDSTERDCCRIQAGLVTKAQTFLYHRDSPNRRKREFFFCFNYMGGLCGLALIDMQQVCHVPWHTLMFPKGNCRGYTESRELLLLLFFTSIYSQKTTFRLPKSHQSLPITLTDRQLIILFDYSSKVIWTAPKFDLVFQSIYYWTFILLPR